MEYLDRGHTQRETRSTFGISLTAINGWRQKYIKTGEVKDDPPPQRKHKKLDPEKLSVYVQEHPDAYLKEIGEVFGCSGTAVHKALERLGITHKKRASGIASKNRNR